ncbi:hypothetical protein GQX74_000903 [Glossina fuscipes]|nr:hypothetical protein GQX74_000903 [Glossina fuscipes]
MPLCTTTKLLQLSERCGCEFNSHGIPWVAQRALSIDQRSTEGSLDINQTDSAQYQKILRVANLVIVTQMLGWWHGLVTTPTPTPTPTQTNSENHNQVLLTFSFRMISYVD